MAPFIMEAIFEVVSALAKAIGYLLLYIFEFLCEVVCFPMMIIAFLTVVHAGDVKFNSDRWKRRETSFVAFWHLVFDLGIFLPTCVFVVCSLRIGRLGKALSSREDKYSIVFEAAGLALLDIICIPFATFCCVAFWRLPSVFAASTSGSVHTKVIEAAGNALVDMVLLPAVLLHSLFPWRAPALFSAAVTREAILRSAGQGLIDIPFAFMALICCISFIQTFGMVSDIWSYGKGTDASSLRDRIIDRFAALFITIIALSMVPLSLYRVFQIKFGLIGGNAEASLKLLEQVLLTAVNVITDAFGLLCFVFLLALPWRFAAALVLMAADNEGREKHFLKSNAKVMCNAVGYAFSRMPRFEVAVSSACRKSLFASAELHCDELQQMCIDAVHDLDALCGTEKSKLTKTNCSPKVASAITFIVCSLRASMHFLLSRSRSVNLQNIDHDKQLQDHVEQWLHNACASSSHLILQFPPPVSLDPVPVQSCIAKMKTAQGGDPDAVIALMELFLCDIRKISTADMNKVWEVIFSASCRARDVILDEIQPPVSFAFWRCTWQDFKKLAPMMLFVAFADMLSIPMLILVLLSGFRTMQVIARLRNSRGGYGFIILGEFMEVLAVLYDIAIFSFVLIMIISAPAMLAQLYDAFLIRSPLMARAAVRSSAKTTITSIATFAVKLFSCRNLVNSLLFSIWFFFMPASVAYLYFDKKKYMCGCFYAVVIGFGLWVCPIISASSSGVTANNSAQAFLAIICIVSICCNLATASRRENAELAVEQGAIRMPVRFNIGNANAVLDVVLEAFQLITITMQILPQSSASSVYSVTAQYETATSYLRIPNVDWWTLYWKLALVIAFIWLSSMIFIQKTNTCCDSSDGDSLIKSSFFRASLSFISNTMMMSIVQTLSSILVCDSHTNTLQIDPSVTCWIGFHRSAAVLSMFLLAFFIPAGWIFGFATARTELSGATDVAWSITYSQSLNGVKLVLPVIFAMLLSTNAVACLALSAVLLGCTLVFSLMYCKIYGNPPGTSIFLWYVRNAALFVSFCLSVIGAVLVNSLPPPGLSDVSAFNDSNVRRYGAAAIAVSVVSVLALLIAEGLRRHASSRAVYHQSTEANEAVQSLLNLESFVSALVDGLEPIKKDRLKSEAQTLGWAAVRAHAIEWFDSLPARAFETHSLAPMSVSLWPKRNQVEVYDFSIIKNAHLHTTSSLVHEWALHQSLFAGDVQATTAACYKHDPWTSDASSDFLDFHIEECATVSRAWLWRVHFLKDCDSSASLMRAFQTAQECLFANSFSEKTEIKVPMPKKRYYERGDAFGLSVGNSLALVEQQHDLSHAQAMSSKDEPQIQTTATFSSAHGAQPVRHYFSDQFVCHPSVQHLLSDPSPVDLTLSLKEDVSEGGVCWVKISERIPHESGLVRWQIRLNKIGEPRSSVWFGVATSDIDLLAQETCINNSWVFGEQSAHANGKVVPHGISLAEGDLITLELQRSIGIDVATLCMTVEHKESKRRQIQEIEIRELPVSAELHPVCYLAARTSYTLIPWIDTHDHVEAAASTESQSQTNSTSALAFVAGDAQGAPKVDSVDSNHGIATQVSCDNNDSKSESHSANSVEL